jgi:hypothetical protein
MDPLSAALVGGIIIGLIVGIPTGRVWAEVSRARADMKRTWESRSAYRKGKK